MSVVCIDTHILIWAIQGRCSHGQDDMIGRSRALIELLGKNDKKLLVPSIVLGEFLIRVPPEDHQTVTDLINRSFMVAEYDARAAAWHAKIYRAKQDNVVLDALKNSGKTRQGLSADRMIVATALANGAECIYSHDKGVRAFGEGFIDVRDVPDPPVQIPLNLIPKSN